MKDGERIYVNFFECRSVEDDWNDGESLTVDSSWTSEDMSFSNPVGGFETVAAAIEAVCKANHFDYDREQWISFGAECGDKPEDFSRFDGDIMVDESNSQASRSEIEKWKAGKKRLWSCRVIVWLEVRTSRDLTEEESNAF